MKKLILFSPLVLLFSFALAESETDSLEKSANAGVQDTGTVNALNLLCKKNWSSEEEKALGYGNRALALAQKINYKKGEAQALNNLGVSYYNFSEYDKALDEHFKALAIRKTLGDKKDISSSLNNIGNAYDGMSDYLHALDFFKQALHLKKEIDDKKGIANISNNIGNLYYSQGNYYKALAYFFDALQIYEEQEELSVAHANVLHNIGNVYKEQKDIKNALAYYEKGLKMREDMEDEQGVEVSYNALAALYLASAVQQKNSTFAGQDYSSAKEYFTKAIAIQEKIEDKTNMAIALNNLGIIYMHEGNYDRALQESFAALQLSGEIGDKSTEAISLGSIADVYHEKNEINKSIEYANKALALADSLRILEEIKNSHLMLSTNYDSLKQFDKSVFHYKLYVTYRDSLLNAENAKQMANVQQKYESEKEQVEEERAKEQQEAELERKEQAQYLVIFSIIILLALFIVIASHLQLSVRTIDFAAFVGVLLFFQFIEVLLHPYIIKYVHGLPIIFICINIALASGLKPIHHLLEKSLVKVSHTISHKRMQKVKQKEDEERRRMEELKLKRMQERMAKANENNPEKNG
ncbi:MAG: tetratricopeptide repeat protein [Bacteroidetes bacterium]|nr:tetratricopeptide repeat protein [Bacteroidota bacterium]